MKSPYVISNVIVDNWKFMKYLVKSLGFTPKRKMLTEARKYGFFYKQQKTDGQIILNS